MHGKLKGPAWVPLRAVIQRYSESCRQGFPWPSVGVILRCVTQFLRAPQWGWTPLTLSGHGLPNTPVTDFYPFPPPFFTPYWCSLGSSPSKWLQFCFWEDPIRHYPNTMLHVSNSALSLGLFFWLKTLLWCRSTLSRSPLFKVQGHLHPYWCSLATCLWRVPPIWELCTSQ